MPTVAPGVAYSLAHAQLGSMTSAAPMSIQCVPNGQPLAALAETVQGKKRSADLLQAFAKVRKCEHEDLGYVVLQAAISAARAVLQTQSSEAADPGHAVWQAFASELMETYKHMAYNTVLHSCRHTDLFKTSLDKVDAIWLGATRAAMGADIVKGVALANPSRAFWQAMISAAMESEDVKFFRTSLKTDRYGKCGGLSWQGDISAATASAMLYEFRASKLEGCACDIFKSLPKF